MAELKKLKENGVDIYPVTLEDVVFDSNGNTLPNKYQTKSDETLNTTDKTIVGAINELFQYNNNNGSYDDSIIKENIKGISSQLEHITKKVNILDLRTDDKTDTEVFKEAIKLAYENSLTDTGWKFPFLIEIPSGIYDIDDTILDSTLDVDAGEFVFKGYGSQNTIINFKPSTEKFLIENLDIFGYASFEGITFNGNYLSKFMNGYSSTKGNAQSFYFNDCYFDSFKQVINSTGTMMMSEVTFVNCKIKGGDSEQVIFSLANPQGVNWRFFATDIELFTGVLFDFIQGCNVSYYSGSIIPSENGIITRINENAIISGFGECNSPNINMNGVRFEMRDNSKLVKADNPNIKLNLIYTACNMGGYNITSGNYVLDMCGIGSIVFHNCYNMQNYLLRSVITGASDVTNPLYLEFNSCDIPMTFIKNSDINIKTDSYLHGSAPIYNFINCLINSTIRAVHSSAYCNDNSNIFVIKKHRISFSSDSDKAVFIFNGLEGGTFKTSLPNVTLNSIKFNYKGIDEYGNSEFTFNIYNEDKSKLFHTCSLKTDESKVINVEDIFYDFNDLGELVFEFIPVSSFEADFILHGDLILEY